MIRILQGFILMLFAVSVMGQSKSFYDFEAKTIDGETIKMTQFKGKKILVVNTASKCGFTPQYEELEALYKKYGGDNFVIIGFPANDFMKQEPGSNDEIAEFCKKNYGVTFQMMAKISVKGKDIDPIYQWLTSKDLNHVMDSKVKWNFQKYLINEEGKLVGVHAPSTKPLNSEIENWVKGETK